MGRVFIYVYLAFGSMPQIPSTDSPLDPSVRLPYLFVFCIHVYQGNTTGHKSQSVTHIW